MIDWEGLLKRHPIFEALCEDDKAFILSDAISRKLVLGSGETIIRQRETGNSLFIVCEGTVSVTLEDQTGGSVPLYSLTEGEVFGEMALFGQQLRSATVTTVEPSRLLEIPGDEFLTLMKKHSEIAFYFLAKLTRRLTQNDNLILASRMTGIDTSVGELKAKLEVVRQTTEAKLAASQTMFDQTNMRANEIIEAAGRARTRLTAMLTAGATILSLIIGGGLWQLDKTLDKIQSYAQQAGEDAGIASKKREEIAKTAEDSTQLSAAMAENARQMAENTKKTEEATQLAAAANQKANELYYEMVLRSLKQNTGERFINREFERIIELVDNSPPPSREQFYDYMHKISLAPENTKKVDALLKTAETFDRRSKLEALLDFRYFAGLSYITRDDFDSASQQQKALAQLAEQVRKDRVRELYRLARGRVDQLEHMIVTGDPSTTVNLERLRLLYELIESLKTDVD